MLHCLHVVLLPQIRSNLFKVHCLILHSTCTLREAIIKIYLNPPLSYYIQHKNPAVCIICHIINVWYIEISWAGVCHRWVHQNYNLTGFNRIAIHFPCVGSWMAPGQGSLWLI